MNNPLWEWLIETRLNASSANQAFQGPSPVSAGPMWCFDRFGQSSTQLPDGRTILIGGEHEDSYDPNFCIYNDLVVTVEGQSPEIYGYPTTTFPPTDFHTASLVDNRIFVLGNLGYWEERCIGETQALVVECRDWSIELVETHGQLPGWIHRHQATVQADGTAILVTGGKIDRGEKLSLVENIDDWLLHLNDWRWERLTERRWDRFKCCRKDGKPNHLWALRLELWAKEVGFHAWASQEPQLRAELGAAPRWDIVPMLYRPPVPHDTLPSNEGEQGVYRIRIDGVVVRFVENSHAIQATIEGNLPREIVDQLRRHIIWAFEALEQCPVTCEDIPP